MSKKEMSAKKKAKKIMKTLGFKKPKITKSEAHEILTGTLEVIRDVKAPAAEEAPEPVSATNAG